MPVRGLGAGVKLSRIKDAVVPSGRATRSSWCASATGQRSTARSCFRGSRVDVRLPVRPIRASTSPRVIAAHHSAERGEALPNGRSSAEIVYALRRAGPGELRLERYVVSGGKRTLLEGTVLAAAQKYGVRPGPRDLTVDRIVTAAVRGVLRSAVWPSLLEALSGAKVELDGKSLRADPEPCSPRARVDEGAAVVLW